MEKTGIKRKLPNLAVEELKLVAGGQLPINAPPGWPTTAGSPSGPGIGPNIPPGWPSTNMSLKYQKARPAKQGKHK